MAKKAKEGWWMTKKTPRYHYFRDGRSLCGFKLNVKATLSPDGWADDPNDCRICRKKLRAEQDAGK